MLQTGRRTQHGVDWNLLQNGPVSMFFKPEVLAKNLLWLKALLYQVAELDCSKWHRCEWDLHTSISDKLGFPDYYGNNMNALRDCMRDVIIPDNSGLVLVFHRYDLFTKEDPQLGHQVLDLLAESARYHLLFGRRLIVLIQSDNPRLSFEPVGASPVLWNPEEWLNKNRGL